MKRAIIIYLGTKLLNYSNNKYNHSKIDGSKRTDLDLMLCLLLVDWSYIHLDARAQALVARSNICKVCPWCHVGIAQEGHLFCSIETQLMESKRYFYVFILG